MISFVVPAYNEERLLGATLRAIHDAARACGEGYELIVADDASTDGTASVAEGHGASVVRVSHRQIASTRNSGARQAQGEFLFFVDADTLVDETVLRASLAALRSGAVGGGAAARFDGRVPAFGRWLLPVIVGLFRILRIACGCFLFCTREAFEATGGYDEKLYASEEIALSKALRRQGRFVVLRETVTTSGRTLRAYSGWEILRILGGLVLRGPKSVRQRRGLEIWYGERRADPGPPG